LNTIRIKRSSTVGSVPVSLQWGELAINTTDNKLFVGGNNIVQELTLNNPSCFVVDSRKLGEHGGTAREKKWCVRTLTNILNDDYNVCTLIGDDFILKKGIYYVDVRAAVYKVNEHKLRLVNETTNKTVLEGLSSDAESGGVGTLCGVVHSNGTDLFEIQHYTSKKRERYGFGRASDVGSSEIYLTMFIIKIGN